ncbi:MAG: hypothetical protein J6Q53_09170 [Oscillospiraceae bacterium]|nr:hypothetical protein [Oscillospiraceae bacterium]
MSLSKVNYVSHKTKISAKNLNDIQDAIIALENKETLKISSVSLLADLWVTNGENLHSQVVRIPGVTPYSQVDLTPSVEQLAVFHNKDLAFVTGNTDGVVTVYAIGQKPTNDYTIQATIKEVSV